MTRRRNGLALVTAVAVVLSFRGLYDLARMVGWGEWLAAGVPVLADAGAAVAADVWLDRSVPGSIRRYARRITMSLIASSVVGNAVGHLLAFLAIPAPWWLVVLVGALAPAVVAANLHLYALVKAGGNEVVPGDGTARPPVLVGMPGFRFTERMPAVEEPAGVEVADPLADELGVAPPLLAVAGDETDDDEDDVLEKARELAAAGVGRPTLVKELGLKDHVARAIVRDHRPRQEVAR